MKIILKPMGIALIGVAFVGLAAIALTPAIPHRATAKAATSNRPVTASLVAPSAPVVTAPVTATSGIIYDGLLKNGWGNYSWAKNDFVDTKQVKDATCIRVDSGSFEALSFHHDPIPVTGYDRVTLRINGGETGGQILKMLMRTKATGPGEDIAGPIRMLPPLAKDRWTTVTVPLAELGMKDAPNVVDLWLQEAGGIKALPTYYVTDVRLLRPKDAAPKD